MPPRSVPPWIASNYGNDHHGNAGVWMSPSQQDRSQRRIQSAVSRRYENKASHMASTGMLVQSRVGDSVISDRLSTKSAVRGVVASNIREKSRLFYLNRTYDRGTSFSRCDMNHQKTLAKLHMSKLLERADMEKAHRQKEQEKILKAMEEREKKKIKSTGKTPFAFGRVKPAVQNKESNITAISMDELKEFIDELDDSEDDDIDRPAQGQSGTATKKVTLTVPKDKVDSKSLTPLKESEEVDQEEGDPAELPDLNRTAQAANGAPRLSSRSPLVSRSSMKSNKPPLKTRTSGLQRPGLTKHRTTLTPETVKALAVKLGATESGEDLDPSASAGRILQVLRQNENAEEKQDSRSRKLTKLLTRANLFSEAALSGLPRNTKRSATDMSDKFLEKYYHMAKGLPSIHAMDASGFQDREWENKEHHTPPFLTEEEWQDIKWCRYVRFSKKFHNPTEIVALDLDN